MIPPESSYHRSEKYKRSFGTFQTSTIPLTTAVFNQTSPKDVLMSFHRGVDPDMAMRPFKQNFGENLMDSIFNKTGEWTRVRSDYHGFDGIYVRDSGSRLHVMIAEAKYNTSQLQNTSHGRQFSESWIRDKFRKLAMRVNDIRFKRVFSAAADGNFPYRARLIRYKPDGIRHMIEFVDIVTGKKKVINATSKDLPRDIQLVLRKEFQNIACRMGYSKQESDYIADEWMKKPYTFDKWQERSYWSWKFGLNTRTAISGFISAFSFMLRPLQNVKNRSVI